ncbi:beta-ketoacyl-[acyl-carrier-protein] synthase family protein [Robbsia andropogonis]|uniref:beta-ketoacyl-[acyl-carrier-protein] synthase family protein n=1 Tax=Robbsia andropogonis TaxID=28092 RepID=UPI0004AC5C78|nr:beta-ketoacyl-[acyl-carrier-protein] synthase family protein [Robbsia andropogonis]
MSAIFSPPVYLRALGLTNALGCGADAVVASVRGNVAPGMGLADTLTGPAYVGRVLRLPSWEAALHALDAGLPDCTARPSFAQWQAALSRYDCRHNRMLLAALLQILPDTAAAIERFGASRVGVVLGTSTSGIEAAERAFQAQSPAGTLPASFDYRQMEIGSAGPLTASVLGVRGPSYTLSTACTSSGKAIAASRRLLQLGLCDAVITGGVDSLCELTLQGFGSLASTSLTRSNPLSVNRNGINIGEGAALFLMSRDAGGVWLAGVGESSDAHHISSPDPAGVGGELALRAALDDAGIPPGAIGYVNLHATATPKNDEMEAAMMARVFPGGVLTSGTKPFTGHMLGAASATELGLLYLMLSRDDMPMPPHCWDGQADPALPLLNVVRPGQFLARPDPSAPHGGRRFLMSNSFAFGGNNVSLIVGDR